VEPNETFLVNVTNAVGASVSDSQGVGTIQNDDTANLVISQLYPGGGLTNATFTNDFIELFNRGATTVDFAVTPYSLQFLSTGGSTWTRTDLTSGTLAPGRYFLIRGAGGAVGAALPAPDAIGSINLTSTTAGKVALAAGTTLLTGNCPGDDGTNPFNPVSGTVADFVGYGGTAATANHCYEGTGPASFTFSNNTIADFRKAGGCTDTNDNTSDFFASGPFPRNSSSPANNCTAGAPPNLTINDVTVTEGNSGTVTATFTVSLSTAAPSTDVTFDIGTANNSATTANSDYVLKSLTGQVIPAGQTSYTFTVIINGDVTIEPDESFFVNVTNVTGATVTDGQATGTIQNDDYPTLSINDVSQNEGPNGTTTFTFNVSLSGPAPAAVTFDIATQDSTATVANNDYVARTLTGQTIAAGQQNYSFDVTVNGDLTIEPNEAFFVNVMNVSGATILDGQGTGTIQNDDSPVLSINDVAVTEGNSGTTILTFTVTSSLPAPAGGITFDIATQDNTATVANNDYVTRSLTSQTIPATQTTYTFDVTINGDTLVETNEAFFVNLSSPVGATIGDGQGVGTITNDDTANLAISQVYGGGNNGGAPYQNDFVEIFNRGTTTVDFSVTPYSIQYAGVGSNFGGATATSKTNLTIGTIAPGGYFLVKEAGGTANGVALPSPDATGNIAMGSTSGKVALVAGTGALPSLTCPGDDLSSPFNPSDSSIADLVGYGSTSITTGHCYEGTGPATAPSNTTAVFRKAGGCTDTGQNAADFFVLAPFPRNSTSPVNNCTAGAPPNLTINDVTVVEGNSGTLNATFTVSLSAPPQGTDVTFDIATANNSATTANSDYVLKSLPGQVIPAGQTSYTFTVIVNGDLAVEPDENFFVNVTNVSGATVIDGQGVGTIQHDDLPTLSINDVSQNETNSGTTTFTFNVSLSAPAPATVTFDIGTQDNTATVANNDYVLRTLTGQTIAAGQQNYSFDVTVNGDLTIEPNEAFFVNVTNVSGSTILDGQGTGTIQNDDSPSLSINDVAVTEGNSGTTILTFTVTSSLPAPAGGITFDIATQDNTATVANNDYVARSLTSQTIPATQTTYTFDVTINGDTLVETNEALFVNLSNPVGANVGDGQGIGTITNDDTANLVISQVYGGGNNGGAPYQNDFVEIFNRGTTTVDFSVTPYSVQYAGVGSNFGGATASSKTPLTTGTIAPGRYFLVKEGGGTANGVPLPAFDASGSILLGSTSGKVALVAGTATLSGVACPGDDAVSPFNPIDSQIADFVGYGNTAGTAGHCYEGTGPAAAPSNTTADFRKAGGCTDTDQNAADFFVSGPFPRHLGSPLNNCTAGPPPNLTISDVTVTEGNSGTVSATFTVSLSAAPQGTDVTFDIATANNSATTANSDYVLKSLTGQLIPAGQTSYTFTVIVNGDLAVEPDENFFVNVTNVSGATVTDGQGVGAIQHDDFPTLSINDVSQNETNSGTTTFTFNVSLSGPAPATVTFDIGTQDNTATVANNDYVLRTLTGESIAAGQQNYSFDVTVNGDLAIEPNEAFFVNVTNVSGATILDGQGTGTIQNDDSPSLSINDVAVTEGNSGTTILTFTVTSSLPAPAGGITFDIATADGTAQDDTPVSEDNDYVARSLTSQTIPATQTTYTFDVTVNSDLLVELNETVFVNLSNPVGANVGDGQGIGTITNDDTATLVISQVYPGGGLSGATFTNDFVEIFNRGATTVNFALTPYSVQFLSTGGSTWAKTDLTSGTLGPGRYFLVREASGGAVGAAVAAPDATGSINLTSTTPGKVALVAGATLLSGNCPGDDGTTPFNPVDGTVADFVGYLGTAATANHCYEGAGPASFTSGNNTIADFRKSGGCIDSNDNAADFVTSTPNPRNSSSPANDCNTGFRPDISINNPTAVTEGDTGTTTLTFTVTLSAPNNTQTVTVNYVTADGTATAGSDYQTAGGSVTFNPTETSQPIVITIDSDLLDEANETFFVNLSGPTNAAILDPQGQGTINDNDPTPSLSINDLPSIPEGDAGTSTATFTVTLSAASGQTVTVNYATADAGATIADNDYGSTSGTLTFDPGDLIKQIPVTINGDATFEPNEAFFVNLTTPVNATISDNQGQGTIINDDAAPPTFDITINDVSIVEGNAGTTTVDFTVSLSNSSAQTVTVDFATSSVSPAIATAGTDYVSSNGTVTFNPSETSKPVTITINGDTRPEPDETFFVDLSNAANATITDSRGVGTITNDDGALVVISQLYGAGGNASATYNADFVELFNRSDGAVTITSWSIQYQAATTTTGAAWAVAALCPSGTCSIPANSYYLVRLTAPGGTGAALPTPDSIPATTINLAAGAGKVALVINTTALTGTLGNGCPSSFASIVDFVGYGTGGSGANCFEGAGAAPTLSAILAAFRKSTSGGGTNGCFDSNNNNTDFSSATPSPRNTSSTNICP
jgi:hypothetical protein